MAAVHCVIVGFGLIEPRQRNVFDYGGNIKGEPTVLSVKHINPYLVDAPDAMIEKRNSPICAAPEMRFGNQPIDGGYFILNEEKRTELIKQEPDTKKFIRPFLGADEFINGMPRYCLWLRDAKPDELRRLPLVMQRVQAVKAFRLESKRAATNELASTPTQFAFVSHSESDYLLLPSVSSERRNFIPIGFASGNHRQQSVFDRPQRKSVPLRDPDLDHAQRMDAYRVREAEKRLPLFGRHRI